MDKERVFNQEKFAADLQDVTAHLQRVYRKHFPEATQRLTPDDELFQLMVQVDLQQQVIRRVADAHLTNYVFGRRNPDPLHDEYDQATLKSFKTLYGFTFEEALRHSPEILTIYISSNVRWDEAVEEYLQKWKRMSQRNKK